MMDPLYIPKPCEIRTNTDYIGSGFGKSEYETIARNIVIISRKIDPDYWTWFSEDDYGRIANHKPSPSAFYGECEILRLLAEKGFLTKRDKTCETEYHITFKFISALAEWIKPEDAAVAKAEENKD